MTFGEPLNVKLAIRMELGIRRHLQYLRWTSWSRSFLAGFFNAKPPAWWVNR